MRKENYVTMYHWSDNTPQVFVPFKYKRFENDKKIIFLTENPRDVGFRHGKEGKRNLYVIKVPKQIKKNAIFNGIFDGAHECVLDEYQWEKCKIIGKVSEKRKDEIIRNDIDFLSIFKKEWKFGSNYTNQYHLPKKQKIKILKKKLPLLLQKEEKIKVIKDLKGYVGSFRVACEIYRKIIEGSSVNEALQLIK
jgi:hypothetical protein